MTDLSRPATPAEHPAMFRLRDDDPGGWPAWEHARGRLVVSNLGLIRRVLVKLLGAWNNRLDHDDLRNEGVLGLMRAIDRFDPGRGILLSTYATACIARAMQTAVADCGSLIRIPKAAHPICRKLADLGEDRMAHARTVLALVPAGRSSDRPWALAPFELRAAPEHDPDEAIDRVDRAAAVRDSIRSLNPRERHIVERRYGLDGADPETMESIGAGLGLTRERVRQNSVAAERKLGTSRLAKIADRATA